MEKDTFQITREGFLKLGIDPREAIIYLENKKAITISPAHVRAYQILKETPAVQTS